MEQQIVTSETPQGLATIVDRLFENGWSWVEGGGSVSARSARAGIHAYAGASNIGGFWAVLERKKKRPPAGFVKRFEKGEENEDQSE